MDGGIGWPRLASVLLEGSLQALHERALLACGRLDGMSALLQDRSSG